MTRQFVLPDLGEGLTEAEIVAVLVREGDVIPEDAPLLEVETDKARVEIPSPIGGRVDRIHVEPGQTVKVGAVLVTFADAEGRAKPGASDSGAAAVQRSAPAHAAGPTPAGAPTRAAGSTPAAPSTPATAPASTAASTPPVSSTPPP